MEGIKLFVVVLYFLHNLVFVNSLLCSNGYKISSEFLNNTQLNTIQCPDGENQRCLRGETVVDFITRVDMIAGACVKAERCDDDCISLVKEASNDVLGLGEQFTVISCKRTCCATDNCNAIFVPNDTEKQNPTTSPIKSMTPLPIVDGASSCSTGIYNITTGKDIMSSLPCAPTNKFCLRQEVTTVAASGELVSYHVGYCANETTCAKSCSLLASQALEDEFTSIQSCRAVCCDFDDCNTLPANELAPLSSRLISLETNKNQILTNLLTISAQETSTSKPSQTSQSTAPINESQTTMPSPLPRTGTTNGFMDAIVRTSQAMFIRETTTTINLTKLETPYAHPKTSFTRLTSSPTTEVPSIEQSSPLLPDTAAPTKCFSGYEIPKYNSRSWKSTECTSSQIYGCLRQEFVIQIDQNQPSVKVTTAACSNAATCNAACEDLARRSLAEGDLGGSRYPSTSQISSCKMICCTSNDCNQFNIEPEDSTTDSMTNPGPASVLPMNFSIATTFSETVTISSFEEDNTTGGSEVLRTNISLLSFFFLILLILL